MTKASKKDVILDYILWIHYLGCFWKANDKVLALIDLWSKFNTIIPVYISKLGLKVRPTNVGIEKVDGSILKKFSIVFASF